MTVAVVFALEREAAPFRRLAREWRHVSIHVSGVGRVRARAAAERLIGSEPSLVIAAGFCGALKPGLRVGDVVTSPRIVTVDHLVTDPAEKRRLGELHDAVDMESATVAANGFRYRIPNATLLCVSDKPLHGRPKLAAEAATFYAQSKRTHVDIALEAVDTLRRLFPHGIPNEDIRSSDEPLMGGPSDAAGERPT